MKTRIELRLFVTGDSDTATRARTNLVHVCEDPWVQQHYDIKVEVVDVKESPRAAEVDNILVTPTLLKKLPAPVRRLVGDLSEQRDIFVTLDIDPPAGREQEPIDDSA